MHNAFALVRAVGFDLDGTLYATTPEMERIVAEKIIEKVLELEISQATSVATREFLLGEHEKARSWSKVLAGLGIENPTAVLANCLATAGIVDIIKKDEALAHLLGSLREKYFLFLISGSLKPLAIKKLGKIGISPDFFNFSFFGDDPRFTSKMEPGNFKYFLSKSPYAPGEHVYIGDSPHTDVFIPKSLGMKT